MVEFKLDTNGGYDILRRNEAVKSLQLSTASEALAIIEAQFFQEFGLDGRFEINSFTTDRSTYKLSAANAATAVVLKRHPGWLNQFIDNMQI